MMMPCCDDYWVKIVKNNNVADLRRELTSEQIDALVKGGDWFPFVEVWSSRTSAELFHNLVSSEYGGPVENMPKIPVKFAPTDFKFSIPPRFRKAFPSLRDSTTGVSYALLTHDVDNRDLRDMNAIGDFYMEDLRLSSSKRHFMDKTPIEMWDRERSKIVELARSKYGEDATPYQIRNTIFSYTKESNPFRPSTALAVYSILNAKSILDMSAGWGDRLIGAMAWAERSKRPIRYQGFDPFCDLQTRYKAMIEDFANVTGSRFNVVCFPFEDSELEENAFDVAFTSPPYFDFEEYAISSSGERTGQSTVRYSGLKEWIEGFLKPMMKKAASSLRRGGYLALNIEGPFVYGVLEEEATFLSTGMQYMGIIGYHSDEPKDKFTHPIFVWRRVA